MSSTVKGSGVHDSGPLSPLAVTPTGAALVSTPEEASVLIRRSSTRKTKAVNYAEDRTQETDGQAEDAFDGPLTELEEDELVDEDPAPKKKKRTRRKVLEPVVYDIPPVETIETSFKGALSFRSCVGCMRVF